jgi:hypothetical protein
MHTVDPLVLQVSSFDMEAAFEERVYIARLSRNSCGVDPHRK